MDYDLTAVVILLGDEVRRCSHAEIAKLTFIPPSICLGAAVGGMSTDSLQRLKTTGEE